MEKVTGLLPIKGTNAGNVMLLGMGSTLLLNDLPDFRSNVMDRTLKKKLKKVLKEAYFSDREKIPFAQFAEYSDDVRMHMVKFYFASCASFCFVLMACCLLYLFFPIGHGVDNLLVIAAVILMALGFVWGPIMLIVRWPDYHNSINSWIRETFLLRERTQFKATINCLVDEFTRISQDNYEYEKIARAVSQKNLGLSVLELGELLRFRLWHTAGEISALQRTAEERALPKTGFNRLTDEMLMIASNAVTCGLMTNESASRGELFKNKIPDTPHEVDSSEWCYEI